MAARLDLDGLRIIGRYGLDADLAPEVAADARSVVARLDGVWVEDKGASVAVHFRSAPASQDMVRRALDAVASGHGLEVIAGKMVWELVPIGAPRKGGAVASILSGLRVALYAGDDEADLEAFAALDAWDGHGVKVAVRGPETPDRLVEAADLTVAGPTGLVALLRQLA